MTTCIFDVGRAVVELIRQRTVANYGGAKFGVRRDLFQIALLVPAELK